MKDSLVGCFAYSKKGHDVGKVYLIIKEEKNMLFLVDGAIKKLENPKKKNRKHVQVIKKNVDPSIKNVFKEGKELNDRRVIQEVKNVKSRRN